LEPILGREDHEELVTKKSESGNVGSRVDEQKMEPMKEYDSVKGGGTIQTDWRSQKDNEQESQAASVKVHVIR
jgi:hypothetical protein